MGSISYVNRKYIRFLVRSFPHRVVSSVARQEGRHRIGRPRNDKGARRFTGDIDSRKNLGARRHSAKPISAGKFPGTLLREIPEKPLSRPVIAPPPGQKVLCRNGCERRRGWAVFFFSFSPFSGKFAAADKVARIHEYSPF